MRSKTPRVSAFDDKLSPSTKLLSSKRLKQNSKYQYNGGTYSIIPSMFRNNSVRDAQYNDNRIEDIENLGMDYFQAKYLLREDDNENVYEEMKMILNRKQNQIETLRIYRDELKLMAGNNNQMQPIKISVQTLKQKAQIKQKLSQQKFLLEKECRKFDRNLDILDEYKKYMQNFLEISNTNTNHQYFDISKEEQVMVKNLETETNLLIKELVEEQKRNSRQIKQIQDEIYEYRIMIKEKEDHLRNLKAKICTLYIKLNSRNKSKSASKSSRDRNMSLSVRKFNNTNHSSIKEAFIGNNTFKSYSRQIIEKVGSDEDLIKIKFFVSTADSETNGQKKQQLYFQCFYKNRQGQIHDNKNQDQSNDVEATRDKISEASLKFQEICVKYLFSMKFYFKSKIVGVECRIKTDKGNKHIQIGACDPNVEHELLTLVNKKIVTLGSYWHGKEMIGISVWYSDKPKGNGNDTSRSNQSEEGKTNVKKRKQKSTYDQYYS